VGRKLIRTHDGAIVLFGGEGETSLSTWIAQEIGRDAGSERVIDLTGSCTLMETAAAMQYVDLVVSNDSGLMHIAAAESKPIVALFGSSVREFGFFPASNAATVLEVQGLPCRPCSHIGRASCPEEHFRCMMDQSVDDVMSAVERSLHEVPDTGNPTPNKLP